MLTEEQERILKMVKIMLGDVAGNPYSPLLEDEEYIALLEQFKWDWKRSVAMIGLSVLAQSAGWATRERVSVDLEIETDFAKNYAVYLNGLMADLNSARNISIVPYVSGIKVEDYLANEADPTNILMKLTQIRTCTSDSRRSRSCTLNMFGG